MITEIARIRVKEGTEAAFEAGVNQAAEVFAKAEGCLGIALNRGIEDPAIYDVVIRWTTLEAHTKDFREGPLFPQWRALVGPYFAEPPVVTHFTHVLAARNFTT